MNRINNILSAVASRKTVKKIVIAAALAGGLAIATPSFADRFDRDDRHDRHDDRRDDHRSDRHDDRGTDVRVNIDLRGGYSRPAPRYEERTTQVWVEPVYRTVTDRVWVAPVSREETTQVWVPERWEERTARTGHGRWSSTRVERVLVERGHYETRCTQVLVCDGHWDDVQREELIAPGHWETRVERVACEEPVRREGFGWYFGFGR